MGTNSRYGQEFWLHSAAVIIHSDQKHVCLFRVTLPVHSSMEGKPRQEPDAETMETSFTGSITDVCSDSSLKQPKITCLEMVSLIVGW